MNKLSDWVLMFMFCLFTCLFFRECRVRGEVPPSFVWSGDDNDDDDDDDDDDASIYSKRVILISYDSAYNNNNGKKREQFCTAHSPCRTIFMKQGKKNPPHNP